MLFVRSTEPSAMTHTLFHYEPLFRQLERQHQEAWSQHLRQQLQAATDPVTNGHLNLWTTAWQNLPHCPDAQITAHSDAVTVSGTLSDHNRQILTTCLQSLHPWRKGPFEFFGVPIDTEWRSCLKWDRLAPHVNFHGRTVLDVGCGNGYYGWRMLNAGASLVLGLDPFLLYVMQFEFLKKFAAPETPHFILPLSDAALPKTPGHFDITLSMGVLYHRSSPIEHLQSLRQTLAPRGTLILETLVLDEPGQHVLVPEDRYAKMRNVWFIPTVDMLLLWLRRTGYTNLRLADLSRTTVAEQRSTPWMTFESLENFLSPQDHSKTIEGLPAPVRALILADRR